MKEKFKTMHDVFDEFTNRTIQKLMSQRHIDGLESPVKIGKESNVFSSFRDGERRIVKIYRLSTCDFNRMFDYIKADPRYIGLKGQRRKVIFSWAQREYRNLLKAREAGVRVPTPFAVLNNVIVMDFVGVDVVAPQLKDVVPSNPVSFFREIIHQMKLLYQVGLVHADLSGFNILISDEKPVFIDMSQSTPLSNPHALDFLRRDIKNVCSLAKKWGVEFDVDSLFDEITSVSGPNQNL